MARKKLAERTKKRWQPLQLVHGSSAAIFFCALQ